MGPKITTSEQHFQPLFFFSMEWKNRPGTSINLHPNVFGDRSQRDDAFSVRYLQTCRSCPTCRRNARCWGSGSWFFRLNFSIRKKKWVDYDLRKQFLLMIWWLGLFGGIFLYEVQETCIYDTCVKICLCISTYGNALLTLDTHISLHAVHILYIVRMFTQVSIDMFWSFFKPLWHRFSFKALKQTPGSPKYLEVDMVAHNQAVR